MNLISLTRRTLMSAAAGLCLSTAVPAMAQTVTLTGTSNAATHHFHRILMVDFAADIERVTEGRVKLRVLPKPVSTYPRAYDAVRDGLADVTYFVHGLAPGRFPLAQMAELPFLGDNGEAISVAYQRIYERHLAKVDEHKGVKVLAVSTHGPGMLYNTKRAITKSADASGLKLRVVNAAQARVAESMGAAPMLKPATESYELLSTGVADGTFFPAEAIATYKLERFIKHETFVPGGAYNTSFVFVMNEKAFNKISPKDQAAIMALAGEKMARASGKAYDEADKAARELMKQAGIQTTVANAAFVQELKTSAAPAEKAWIEQANALGLDGAKVLQEFRDEIKKVAAGQ